MDVSIIIPVYNAKDFIIDCLRSVSDQKFNGTMECILVDDCGQDNSIDLAERFIDSLTPDNRKYIILRQCKNHGPSSARNRGIREATGEYVIFLDADDTLTPISVDSLFKQAKAYNLDYVQGAYQGDNNKLTNSQILDSNNLILDRKLIKRTLLNYNIIPFTPHNRLVRRTMLLDYSLFFNEEIRVREDFLWMTFVAKYVTRFGYCPVVTYIRGYNEDSLTHKINLERELKGYTVLIKTMCANIDTFQRGYQMELVLSALVMLQGLMSGDKNLTSKRTQNIIDELISQFYDINKFWEKSLLRLYFLLDGGTLKTRVLHILVRLYKIKD